MGLERLNEKELKRLAVKKLQGTITEEEKAVLDRWLEAVSEQVTLRWTGPDQDETTLRNRLLEKIRADIGLAEENTAEDASVGTRPVTSFVRSQTHYQVKRGVRWAAAVLLVMGIAAAIYWMVRPNTKHGDEVVAAATIDVAPGINGAILTLSDGTRLSLDSTQDGLLQHVGGLDLTLDDGTLTYKAASTGLNASSPDKDRQYNIVTTPYGKQFKVVLPDGTKAWLNAGSSLKYPTNFFVGGDDIRTVEMTGEVYFEVAKNESVKGKKRPFKVLAAGQEITVLGTHFNVQAYEEDKVIKTTLTEGRVEVAAGGIKPVILTPGEQSNLSKISEKIVVKEVDANAVISWTRGFFSFRGASIREVMEQFSRWYNVDVQYEGEVTDRRFSGKIYRNLSAQRALDALSFMQLHFEISHGTIGADGRPRTIIKVKN